MASYTVTIRREGKVERNRFEHRGAALEALRARLEELTPATPRAPRQVLAREITPERLVVARGEIAGPRRLRGGVDVRGDGSAEAYTGRVRRRTVEAHPGESAYEALARAIAAADS